PAEDEAESGAAAPDATTEAEEGEDGAESAEVDATETIRLAVKPDDDESVLVTVASDSASPTLALEWVQDRRAPLAGPLLLAGGILALVGALLYLWAVDHDRRGLGPRRGRRGPLLGIRNVIGGMRGKKSRGAAFVAIGLAGA